MSGSGVLKSLRIISVIISLIYKRPVKIFELYILDLFVFLQEINTTGNYFLTELNLAKDQSSIK